MSNVFNPRDILKLREGDDLHALLRNNPNLEDVQALLHKHPKKVYEKDRDGYLPLHTAVSCNASLDVINLLLKENGSAARKAENNSGRLPLHIVMLTNKCGFDVVKALLHAHPEGSRAMDIHGNLPLHLALMKSRGLDVLMMLLDAYPDGAKTVDKNGKLPLHIALEFECEFDVVTAVHKAYPEGVEATDDEGSLPLHIAIQHDIGNFRARWLLHEYTEGVCAKNNNGNSPLHIAVQYSCKFDLMERLLLCYPDGAKELNNEGKLPLRIAIEHEREARVVNKLLKAYPEGAKTLGKLGKQSFTNAIELEYPVDVVFALLQADMPLDNDGKLIEHDDSWNVCIAAEEDAAVDAVKRILYKYEGNFGKHIHALAESRDSEGRTALGLAKLKARSIIYEYLLFCGWYKLKIGSPEHRTLTSILIRAYDYKERTDYGNIFAEADKDGNGTLDHEELQNIAKSIGLNPELFLKRSEEGERIKKDEFVSICKQQLGDGFREVVIKFMRSKEHWQRECNARRKHNLSPKYVVSVLPNTPCENDIAYAVKNGNGGLGIIKEKYLEDIEIGKYAIVMDAADRNLHQIFYQEQPKIDAVRDMLKQVFEAVNHLHGKKLMHGDLKMLNIVRMRVDNRLRLIDFDASVKIMQPGEDGESFAGAKFSSAILPPEMIAKLDAEEVDKFNEYWQVENDEGLMQKVAPKVYKEQGVEKSRYVVKSFRTEGGEPVFEGLPYDLVHASEEIDAWSLGVLAFTLLTGESLIPSNRDDDCASGAAMHLLYTWGTQPEVLDDLLSKIQDRAARDLVLKLLQFEPKDRPSVKYLLGKHPFFTQQQSGDLSDGIDDIKNLLDKAAMERKDDRALLERIDANVMAMKKLTIEGKYELRCICHALMKGIFEATMVDIPTTFIILQNELQEIEPNTGGDSAHCIEEFLKKMVRMIKDGIQEQLVGETMYLYLVDDLTGKPVQAKDWPIEITKPSEIVRKLLPLMRVGVRGMSIYNGVVGVVKMFGVGVEIPEGLLNDFKAAVEQLKQKSSVEDFDVVHDTMDGGSGENISTRDDSLRVFRDFLNANDPGLKERKSGDFAGLQRIGDPNQGTALWTKLTDPKDIEDALKERTRQRSEEIRRRKKEEGKQQLTTASSRFTNMTSTAGPNVGEPATTNKTSATCECMIL